MKSLIINGINEKINITIIIIYIMKNFAYTQTPKTTNEWTKLSEDLRKKKIIDEISNNDELKEFEVRQASKDGQIVFKISKSISSNTRGLLLLSLEEQLKNNIDQGLTVWLEPVGDRSKLRNLRGVKITSEGN